VSGVAAPSHSVVKLRKPNAAHDGCHTAFSSRTMDIPRDRPLRRRCERRPPSSAGMILSTSTPSSASRVSAGVPCHDRLTRPRRAGAVGSCLVSLRRAPRRSGYRSGGRSQIRLLRLVLGRTDLSDATAAPAQAACAKPGALTSQPGSAPKPHQPPPQAQHQGAGCLGPFPRGIKDPAPAVPDRAMRPEELPAPTCRSLLVAALFWTRDEMPSG
jgi:hypothetical protein